VSCRRSWASSRSAQALVGRTDASGKKRDIGATTLERCRSQRSLSL